MEHKTRVAGGKRGLVESKDKNMHCMHSQHIDTPDELRDNMDMDIHAESQVVSEMPNDFRSECICRPPPPNVGLLHVSCK